MIKDETQRQRRYTFKEGMGNKWEQWIKKECVFFVDLQHLYGNVLALKQLLPHFSQMLVKNKRLIKKHGVLSFYFL